MSITARQQWPYRLIAALAVAALAALAVPALAGAHQGQKVRAYVKQGVLKVKGTQRSDSVALRLKAGDTTRVQVDVGDDGSAEYEFDRASIQAIQVKLERGNDSARIDDANGAFTDTIPTDIAGGRGKDTLNGGAGAETLRGGRGYDHIDGGRGNDTAFLGRGNDSFTWDPGEGSDVIEGQRGYDTMVFNGAAANETVTLTANGKRLKFFRDPAAITMDTSSVEKVTFNALGGTDSITVGDLRRTDVARVNLDLAGTLGGTTADGAIDNVTVNGTNGRDRIRVRGNGSGADVRGLASTVSLKHADPTDTLSVNTLAGNDDVRVQDVAGALKVSVDGVLF